MTSDLVEDDVLVIGARRVLVMFYRSPSVSWAQSSTTPLAYL